MVDQIIDLLRQRRQVTYRILKRQFALDDESFKDLKEELLYSHPEVADDAGRGLVWVGVTPVPSTEFKVPNFQPLAPHPQPPISYTPAHLAERIRAEQAALEARGASDGERKTRKPCCSSLRSLADNSP